MQQGIAWKLEQDSEAVGRGKMSVEHEYQDIPGTAYVRTHRAPESFGFDGPMIIRASSAGELHACHGLHRIEVHGQRKEHHQ